MLAMAWMNNYQQAHWKYEPTYVTTRKVRIPLILLIKTVNELVPKLLYIKIYLMYKKVK